VTEDLVKPLLSRAELARALSLRDLTEAARGPHAMQLLINAIVDALALEVVIVHRASPIVHVRDNYDRLHYPPDGAARDARYTRYLDDELILRTQTSAMIPDLLLQVARLGLEDVLLVCPGLVYRRDVIDRLHVGEPHQLDLWRVAARPLEEEQLEQMISRMVQAALPGAVHRTIPAQHPYTERGRQIDVRDGDRWVEIGECGLASPRVLADAGLAHASGLAMGLGVDRILMMRKGIDDIRLLRSDDPRIEAQLRDLTPYRPVSKQPPIRRDLSIAVASETTGEELGDRVRDALEQEAEMVETIEVLSETPYAELPEPARERLGIDASQKNVLLRVVLRHVSRTLSHAEANLLRDRIYAALHRGRPMPDGPERAPNE
jgi:phenylalanyl-tRNA synthetase alpha chain